MDNSTSGQTRFDPDALEFSLELVKNGYRIRAIYRYDIQSQALPFS